MLLTTTQSWIHGSTLAYYVFPASDGGLCRLDSLKQRFKKLRDQARSQKELRLNHWLRNMVASMTLSNGVNLAEVAHQLGHAPGLAMTKRYTGFIPAAQRSTRLQKRWVVYWSFIMIKLPGVIDRLDLKIHPSLLIISINTIRRSGIEPPTLILGLQVPCLDWANQQLMK